MKHSRRERRRKPQGLLIREAIRNSQTWSQKGLESDGTANLLCRLSHDAASLCRQRPHGMNAGDGYCGSSGTMTDLVLPKVSVYQACPIHRILRAGCGLSSKGNTYQKCACLTRTPTLLTCMNCTIPKASMPSEGYRRWKSKV